MFIYTIKNFPPLIGYDEKDYISKHKAGNQQNQYTN